MIDAAREVIPQLFGLALVFAAVIAGAHYGPKVAHWWRR